MASWTLPAHLTGMATPFGQVTQGMDVVDKIRKVETTQRGPYGDVPVPVVIKQVTIEK